MPSTHHDLSVTSYGMLGLFAVGYELVGLRATLFVALCLAGLVLAISLMVALLSHLRKRSSRPVPRERVGRMR